MTSAGTAQDLTITKTPFWVVNGTQTHDPSALSSTSPIQPLQNLNRNRFYRPDVGMFLSRDPLLKVRFGVPTGSLGPKAYAFAEGNPIIYFDPFGLEAGSPCCAEIKKRMADVEKTLDVLQEGGSALTGATGFEGLSSCAGEYYSETGEPTGRTQYNADLSRATPCTKACVVKHEKVHERQCHKYGALGILSQPEASLELPAYMEELGCLIGLCRSAHCCSCP